MKSLIYKNGLNQRIKSVLNFLIVVLMLTSCSKNSNTSNPRDDDNQKVEIVDNRVVVRPTEYHRAIRNPMKGLREYFNPAMHARRSQYPYPYGTLIKEYMQWDNLENKKSDGVDKIINYSNHRWRGVENDNVKVIPRVYIVWREPWDGGMQNHPTNPDDLRGSHWPSDIPEQVYSEDPNTPITGGYFDPTFQDRVRELIRKLGKAWDDDPRVAYIEMGIIGHWGEHHDPSVSTYWAPHTQGYHVANRTWIPGIEETLGDAFTEAFKNKKVMVRYAYDFTDYEFGIYWDSFALPQEESRGYNEMLKLGDRWKTQPIGGELSWQRGDHAVFNSFEELVADERTRERIITHIRDLHCNHIGGITWADFNDANFLRNAEILQRNLGYRFVIEKFSYPEMLTNKTFTISMDVVNTASSPFYYDWPLEVSLLDPHTKQPVWSDVIDDVNISEWMPGDIWDTSKNTYQENAEVNRIDAELKVDKNIPDGKYIISISILDPAGMLPSLRFANINYFEGGRHPLGYIGFNTKLDDYEIPAANFDNLEDDYTLKYVIEN